MSLGDVVFELPSPMCEGNEIIRAGPDFRSLEFSEGVSGVVKTSETRIEVTDVCPDSCGDGSEGIIFLIFQLGDVIL